MVTELLLQGTRMVGKIAEQHGLLRSLVLEAGPVGGRPVRDAKLWSSLWKHWEQYTRHPSALDLTMTAATKLLIS